MPIIQENPTRFPNLRPILWTGVFLLTNLVSRASAQDLPTFRFEKEPGQVKIYAGDLLLTRYVYIDETIPRPYFCDVKTLDGIQVTRNHPPIEGVDISDHSTYHPGIWLAFGILDGADFWRLKARVEQARFVEEPEGKPGEGSFTVEKVYLDGDREICREICRYRFLIPPQAGAASSESSALGYLLLHDSEFFSDQADFVFGDQEEMGLGVRLASPISVAREGTLTNSAGLINQEQVWGKQADWCDNAGPLEGRHVGATLIPHPDNFRKSWFHARDYGLILGNPFGRNAYTGEEKSAITIKKGERFPLRYGVYLYSTSPEDTGSPVRGYEAYLKAVR